MITSLITLKYTFTLGCGVVRMIRYPEHGLTPREIEDMEPRRNIIKAAVMLMLIFILSLVLSYLFKGELEAAGLWLVERLGFFGMFLTVLIMDTFIMPVSPDIVIFVSIAGDMNPLLALIAMISGSILGGNLGYLIGRYIGKTRSVRVMMGRNYNKGVYLASRYGMRAVVLGAFTPVPFSTTCWLAGMFQLRYVEFLIATTYRMPRFLLWYLIIGTGFNFI